MATSVEAKLVNGKWTIPTDPDDQLFYVFNVIQWLADSLTSLQSFEIIPVGMDVMQQGVAQGNLGGLIPVKLKFAAGSFSERYCTIRVTTEDGQRFDKTLYFTQVQN